MKIKSSEAQVKTRTDFILFSDQDEDGVAAPSDGTTQALRDWFDCPYRMSWFQLNVTVALISVTSEEKCH